MIIIIKWPFTGFTCWAFTDNNTNNYLLRFSLLLKHVFVRIEIKSDFLLYFQKTETKNDQAQMGKTEVTVYLTVIMSLSTHRCFYFILFF